MHLIRPLRSPLRAGPRRVRERLCIAAGQRSARIVRAGIFGQAWLEVCGSDYVTRARAGRLAVLEVDGHCFLGGLSDHGERPSATRSDGVAIEVAVGNGAWLAVTEAPRAARDTKIELTWAVGGNVRQTTFELTGDSDAAATY